MNQFLKLLLFLFITTSESALNLFSSPKLVTLPLLKQISGGIGGNSATLTIPSNRGGVITIKNKKQFDDVLNKANNDKQLVVIDFSAKWCPPCRMIAPRYDEIANSKAYSNVVFLKVDVDEVNELVNQYSIRSMPTFLFIANKKEINRFSGANIELLHETIQQSLQDVKNNKLGN